MALSGVSAFLLYEIILVCKSLLTNRFFIISRIYFQPHSYQKESAAKFDFLTLPRGLFPTADDLGTKINVRNFPHDEIIEQGHFYFFRIPFIAERRIHG